MLDFTFTCDICKRKFERFIEPIVVKDGICTVMLYQELPSNWSFVRGLMICSSHSVELTDIALYVDGALQRIITKS